jgi:large subunit ribosomal protein L33
MPSRYFGTYSEVKQSSWRWEFHRGYRRFAVVLPDANDNHYEAVGSSGDRPRRRILVARNQLRPVIKLRSTSGTGYTYLTRKSRRNDPDRLTLRKYDPIAREHVLFREER